LGKPRRRRLSSIRLAALVKTYAIKEILNGRPNRSAGAHDISLTPLNGPAKPVSAEVEQHTPGWMDDSDHAGGHTALDR
jgi:hypothetical protein